MYIYLIILNIRISYVQANTQLQAHAKAHAHRPEKTFSFPYLFSDYDKLTGNDTIGEVIYNFDALVDEESKDLWLSLGKNNGEIHVRLTMYPESKKKK